MLRRFTFCLALLLLTASVLVLRADTFLNYSFRDRGSVSIESQGAGSSLTVGYARVVPTGPLSAPAGVAIYGLRQGGVVVTEAGVPAASPVSSGRFFAHVDGKVNTGVAIANPNGQTAQISFFYTDLTGRDFGAGSTSIPANGQVAAFLNEPPFNSGNSVEGTFTFTSNVPIAVIALRGFTNERNEFLVTTLPIASLAAAGSAQMLFPHFANGSGWTTQVVLINTTNSQLSGTIRFLSFTGLLEILTVNGQTNSTFNYSIPPKSSVRFQTSGVTNPIQHGSVEVTPQGGTSTPSGLVIFTFKNAANVTVSEAGVQPSPISNALRVYAEASEIGSSVMTGIAIANAASTSVTVRFELTSAEGGLTGLTGSETIPGKGQLSKFLNEIQGFSTLPRPFKGVLRISTDSTAGVAVTGLRGRTNERNDFLTTTTPAIDEKAPIANGERFFPQVIDGGGYSTQFVLYSGGASQASAGLLRIFRQNGQPFDMNFGETADLMVSQQPSKTICSFQQNGCDGLIFDTVVVNRGPGTARAVTVTDFLPVNPQTGAVAASVTQITSAGSLCSQPLAGVVSCDLGDLPVGQSRVITIKQNLRSEIQGRRVTNISHATSRTPDMISSDGMDSVDVATSPSPTSDVSVTASVVPPSSVRAGNPLTYTLRIVNSGPTTATDVTVTNTFSGIAQLLFYQTFSSPGCSVASQADTISCDVGTLPPNVPLILQVVIQPNNTGVLTNQVEVTAAEIDPNTQNNKPNALSVTVNP